MTALQLMIVLLLMCTILAEEQQQTVLGHLRRLVGSNCIQIEVGIVTPYYKCDGCEIEKATECLQDMRLNKSGNVRPGCPLDSAFLEPPDAVCCPTINDKLLLDYAGSSYPAALTCMEQAGCKSSTVYQQLARECTKVCHEVSERCFTRVSGATGRLPGQQQLLQGMLLVVAAVLLL